MINGSPLVTIITPSYNQAAYLEYTMRSVFEQDYPAIEYLVVDGASEDRSLEIINKYSARLSWWVSEPDNGQAEAINKGFARARGEIVGWLNSDDIYLPGAVAGAVEALRTHPEAGFVYGDAITIDAEGHPLKTLVFPDWGLQDLIGFRIICQPAVFIRRQTLLEVGELDVSYHYLLDHQLWLRIAQKAPPVHIPAFWAAARHHPAAKNVAQAEGFGGEAFRILSWMQGQSDLKPILMENRPLVVAGAHRLNARYLLDGGFPGKALAAYWQATLTNPGFALRHWHRMVFALLSILGGRGLGNWYYRLRQKWLPDKIDLSGLENWPGICIES